MKVLKFGGSSVANAENIGKVAEILVDYYNHKQSFAVVFSAFGGVTDYLIKAARLAEQVDENYLKVIDEIKERHIETINLLFSQEEAELVNKKVLVALSELTKLLDGIYLLQEASIRSIDFVLSFGERMSSFIISQYLLIRGIPASYLDARRLILTNDRFGEAIVDFAKTSKNIVTHFNQNEGAIQIITGFIGANSSGITTTLGRGGSDYTASIFANSLDASSLEIWTDVSGVLTSDPRKVKKAYPIDQLSYNEAMEMSHFGAKVIYPPTIQPVLSKNIPIFIKNTFDPSHPGTKITKNSSLESLDNNIKGVSAVSDIALLNFEGSALIGTPGIAAKLFGILATNDINIIMIIQASSEHSISFAVKETVSKKAKSLIEETFEDDINRGTIRPVSIQKGLSIIAVIGENMKNIPGISGKLFSSLGRNNINVVAIAQGSSELNISFLIQKQNEHKALNLIHDSFFLSNTKTINLFVIGTGNIGATLIDQIIAQRAFLKKERKLDLRIVGLSNSKKMVFIDNGVNLNEWQEQLKDSSKKANVSSFVETMISKNLANSIFVDNTANNIIPQYYHEILKESIAITTPNKIASSSKLNDYITLKKLARANNTFFMYETNVGAGLPVISTLQNLLESGDKIIEIQAVLSGTLSYIFNLYDGSSSFASLVKEAQKGGYTEPDPRDDLSGQDVLRKATILARECGIMIEKEDIKLDAILSNEALSAKDVNDFYNVLSNEDPFYKNKALKASNKSKKLRFIAEISNKEVSASLQEVSNDSPFYHLSGTDNMILFRTERYKSNPLVIKGPGAGAGVTAAGIFSEIIQIAYKL